MYDSNRVMRVHNNNIFFFIFKRNFFVSSVFVVTINVNYIRRKKKRRPLWIKLPLNASTETLVKRLFRRWYRISRINLRRLRIVETVDSKMRCARIRDPGERFFWQPPRFDVVARCCANAARTTTTLAEEGDPKHRLDLHLVVSC